MSSESIKDRIREYCVRKHITQRKLEEDLKLGKGYVSKVDKTAPNMAKLKLIADYFDIQISQLIGETSVDEYFTNPESARVAQEIFEKPELRMLIDAAKDVEPEDLIKVTQMLKAWKGEYDV